MTTPCNDIQKLNEKIALLKQRKTKLQEKMAQTFFKKLHDHVASIDPMTLLGFLMDHWPHPTSTQRERWQAEGARFFPKGLREKALPASSKDASSRPSSPFHGRS